MVGFPAARKGDPVTHDMLVPSGVIGPPVTGPCPMGVVQVENLPAAHVNCTAVTCSGATSAGVPAHPPLPIPPAPPPPIVIGSTSVLVHNLPAARWSPSMDAAACTAFLGDPKLTPTRTVLIGGPTASVSTTGGQLSVDWGGLQLDGPSADVMSYLAIIGREMSNSNTFRDTILEIINDPAHPVIAHVGRGNAYWIDSFNSKNVDLDDLEWFPVDPPADYPWARTQGETVLHHLAERRHAAVTGSGFGPAHAAPMAPNGAQHQYRRDRGQPGRIVSQVRHTDPANPHLNRGISTDDSGNEMIFHRDDSSGQNVPNSVEYKPAHPTPAAPGETQNSPPGSVQSWP